MKNIWIFYSKDGPIYFSNPKKAYESAKEVENTLPAYSTYLKKIRVDGCCDVTEDTNIVKVKVL